VYLKSLPERNFVYLYQSFMLATFCLSLLFVNASDVSDAARNCRTRSLALRPPQLRLCRASIDVVHQIQHAFISISNALVVGGGRSIGVVSATGWPLLLRGCGKHATVSPPSR
jgi:hypothetical protein